MVVDVLELVVFGYFYCVVVVDVVVCGEVYFSIVCVGDCVVVYG